MKRAAWRVATYRFRAMFGRRWGGCLALALFIALIGGLAMGSVAYPAEGVLGRSLWDLFAHEISVVPAPAVPVTAVVLIAVGAVALGNLAAALPARMAARTPTALLLRAE